MTTRHLSDLLPVTYEDRAVIGRLPAGTVITPELLESLARKGEKTVRQQVAANLGSNMAMQFDAALRACIEKRTGPLSDLSVLRGRLEAVRVQGSDKTTYYLDGEAIARSGEIEVKMRGNMMHAERFFQELPLTPAAQQP